MNKAKTNLLIVDKIYHLKAKAEELKSIKLPNNISDHPIILFKTKMNVEIEKNQLKIIITDKKIVEQNSNALKQIYISKSENAVIINPNRTIEINNGSELPTTPELIEEYKTIKEENMNKFRIQRGEDIAKLKYLLNSETLNKQSFNKITSMLQTSKKSGYWFPTSEIDFKEIISGFQKLYKQVQESKPQPAWIGNKMIETLNLISKQNYPWGNQQTPNIPRSNAKDIMGLSQKEIITMIRDDNSVKTLSNLYKWITNIIKNPNISMIIHQTSKLILKKKTSIINSYEDLRGIAIMPVIVMVFDKLISPYIKDITEPLISKQQFAWRQQSDTNIARLDWAFTAATKGYKK
ncbi:MAG: hypothetical protein ACRC42_01650, partial [Mycoplasma sp.]